MKNKLENGTNGNYFDLIGKYNLEHLFFFFGIECNSNLNVEHKTETEEGDHELWFEVHTEMKNFFVRAYIKTFTLFK